MGLFDWIKQDPEDKKFGEISRQIERDEKELEIEENEFENQKNSMKFSTEAYNKGEYIKNNKTVPIFYKILIYSNKKLSREELNDINKSIQEKILLTIDCYISSNIGEIVLNGTIINAGAVDESRGKFSLEKLKELRKKHKPYKILFEVVKISLENYENEVV